jgi:hypothetical protein
LAEICLVGVFDLFSKRQKRLRGEVPDVYMYDVIPEPLRVQAVHILRDALGGEAAYVAGSHNYYTYPAVRGTYDAMNNVLCREYGVFSLVPYPSRNCVVEDIFNYLLKEPAHERVLDVIELALKCIDNGTRDWNYLHRQDASEQADAAINELNARFKEHGIGYEYKDGLLIRVDSELIHAESVKPALGLLVGQLYQTANSEFLRAHEHYRHQRYEDCLTWAVKSLESTMKAICEKRKWHYSQNDTAKKLVDICFQEGLIPTFWQSHFSALRSTLESGAPTARNALAGHGQGIQPVQVPHYLAAYILHMTASTLVFLVEAEKSLP